LEKNHVGYFLNSPRMMVFYEYVMNPVVIWNLERRSWLAEDLLAL
jgi:hypothetical protein